jgi:protease-4
MKEQSPFKSLLLAALRRAVMVFVTWTALAICIVTSIIGFGFFAAFFAASDIEETPTNGYSSVYGTGYHQLLSIKVTGAIYGTQGGGFLDDASSGYHVKEQLQTAADDDTVAGVILEVNSPGGTIYGARA